MPKTGELTFVIMSMPRTLFVSSLLFLVRVAFSFPNSVKEPLLNFDNVISPQQVEPQFSFTCTDLNTIEIDYQIKSKTQPEFRPVDISFLIDGQSVAIIKSSGDSAPSLQLNQFGKTTAVLSETSIPTHRSGIFNMLISMSSVENAFDDIEVPVNVEIGCTDPKRIDYMECILNCEKWGLRW
jgi:hypothetical protein